MKYTKKVLKNGMRIIVVPMKSNPTATVLAFVEAGSKYENKHNNGISHFLEHMFFKGTKKRPHYSDIANAFDGIGAISNAFTSQEFTAYYAKADYKHADTILDIISDMYINSTFPEADMEKEKGVVIEEINRYADMPEQIISNEFLKLLYGDQPVGRSIGGPKENIQNMTRQNFIDYCGKHYVASATTVIVAGKVDEKETIKKVTKAFKEIGTWKKEGKLKVIESQKIPQASVFYKETDQTHLVLGVRAFDVYHKYNRTLDVIEGILSGGMSSRLFTKLRDEMGICYTVSASTDGFTDHGFFSVYSAVDTKRVKEAIAAILEELTRLKTERISAEELNKVKQYLVGTLRLRLESSNAIANFFGEREVLREVLKTPEDIIKDIQAVTAEEIQFVAQKIFKNEGLNLSLVGKFKEKEEFLPLLKL